MFTWNRQLLFFPYLCNCVILILLISSSLFSTLIFWHGNCEPGFWYSSEIFCGSFGETAIIPCNMSISIAEIWGDDESAQEPRRQIESWLVKFPGSNLAIAQDSTMTGVFALCFIYCTFLIGIYNVRQTTVQGLQTDSGVCATSFVRAPQCCAPGGYNIYTLTCMCMYNNITNYCIQ